MNKFIFITHWNGVTLVRISCVLTYWNGKGKRRGNFAKPFSSLPTLFNILRGGFTTCHAATYAHINWASSCHISSWMGFSVSRARTYFIIVKWILERVWILKPSFPPYATERPRKIVFEMLHMLTVEFGFCVKLLLTLKQPFRKLNLFLLQISSPCRRNDHKI